MMECCTREEVSKEVRSELLFAYVSTLDLVDKI